MTTSNEVAFTEQWTTSVTLPEVITSLEPEVTSSSPWQVYVYNMIGALGLVSNGFVVFVISTSKTMRTKVTNKLIINQSIIDMMGCIFMMIFSKVEFNPDTKQGLWDDFKCRFWTGKIIMWGLFVSSAYNLVIITVERWSEIRYPLQYKAYLTPTVQKVLFVIPWLFGLTFETIYVVPSSGIVDGQCVIISIFPSFAASVAAQLVMNSFKFYLPLIATVGFYISIFITLRQRKSLGAVEVQKSAAEKAREERMARARRNVLKTMLIVCVISFGSFVFNQQLIILLAVNVLDPSMFSTSYYHASVVIVFMNLCINPFVYSIQYTQFQQAVRKLFGKFYRVEPSAVEMDASTLVSKY